MKPRLSWWILLGVIVCLTSLWTSPAAARLYPPLQDISYSLENSGTTIRYWTTNLVWSDDEETWTVPQADQRQIVLPPQPVDQGILTWYAQYKNYSDAYYTYRVEYRIYDPGRGVWKAGSWGPFTGYNPWLEQHQVKDGVVTWIAHRQIGAAATDNLEHQVIYATYNPQFGSWVQNNSLWPVAYTDKSGPEVLRVKNGVVAWPMRDAYTGEADEADPINVFTVIYDQVVSQWIPSSAWYKCGEFKGFDWIEIPGDATQVHIRLSVGFPIFSKSDFYTDYDAYNHQWNFHPEGYVPVPTRRAFFVAAPNLVFVPFTTWFWDCSFALDGVNTPSTWSWDIDGSDFSVDRSPALTLPFFITFPGPYDYTDTITEHVTYNDSGTLYTATGQVEEKTPAPPSGGISINNGAAYTSSANVTLSLNYDPSAIQMCFRQTPGLYLWGAWEPVASSKAWTLSTIHELGTSVDGPHTVYVKFKDQYGQESQAYSYPITLVTTPPKAYLMIENSFTPTTTNSRNVRVGWWAESDYPMEWSLCYIELVHGTGWGVWSPWVHYESLYGMLSKTISFNSPARQQPVMLVEVQFKDDAGNITQVEASIALKPPPLGHLPLLLMD